MTLKFVFNPFTSKFDAVNAASTSTGTATVNFGTPASNDTTTSVAVAGQSGILSTSVIQVAKRVEATADHSADEVLAENWEVEVGNIVPGVGFTIYAKCTVGRTYGRFNVDWAWN